MHRRDRNRYARMLCVVAGGLWQVAPQHPWLAVASLLAPLLIIPAQRAWQVRLLLAFGYFFLATSSTVPSFVAFFGQDSVLNGFIVWLLLALYLAAPWALARGPWTALVAAAFSGLLGPMSIWPLAGLFFPGMGLAGLVVFGIVVYCVGELGALVARGRPAVVTDHVWMFLLVAAAISNGLWFVRPAPRLPAGWVAVDTRVTQTGNHVFSGLRNTQQVIADGLAFPRARVLVFPEAVLDDMLPGTVDMMLSYIPPKQIWLVGAEDGQHDAVWGFEKGHSPVMVSDSVLPMPVSMWRPWSSVSYRPAWHKRVFVLDGKRVWSSICYEQVTPLAWVQALAARPDVVLLQSNAWWADQRNPAPAIQAAQANAWLRLMRVASLAATNTR